MTVRFLSFHTAGHSEPAAFLTFATSSPLSVSSTTELTVQPSGVASVVNLPLCHNEKPDAAVVTLGSDHHPVT